jgi:hypothetical protein
MTEAEHDAKLRAIFKEEERKDAMFQQTMKLEVLRFDCQLLQEKLLKKQLYNT